MAKRFWKASHTSPDRPLPHGQAQLVRRHLAVAGQQIAAQFADILEDGGAAVGHIAPEGAGGEFLAQDHRAAAQQHRARRHHAAHAVIHGQAVVEPVIGAGAGHAGEPVGPAHHPAMADMGRLGQAGGAGGVDQQGAVVQGDVAVSCRQRRHRKSLPAAAKRPRHSAKAAPSVRQLAAPAFGGDDMGGRGHGDAMAPAPRPSGWCSAAPRCRRCGDAQPDRQIVGAVGQQQADRVALADILGQRPARYLVGARGQAAWENVSSRRSAPGLRRSAPQFLDHRGQDARGRVLDLRRHFQRAQPGLGGGRRFAGQGEASLRVSN